MKLGKIRLGDMKTGRAVTNRFLTIFTLVSRIPVKKSFETDFSRADFWLPAISPLVSLASLLGFGLGMTLSGNIFLSAIASIALQYFLFNIFHLDGLVDTADAMLPAASPEKRLEILKDPRVGTYGFFCGLAALAARAGAISLLSEGGIIFSALIAGFLIAPLSGRLAAALVPLVSKPARPTGLGALMSGFSARRIAGGAGIAYIPALAYGIAAGSWILPVFCFFSTAAAAAGSAFFISRTYSAKVGGFTGDALGAAVEIGEISSLLILGIAVRLAGGIPA
ncbi:MAG TPA: adenosylcobinamide-GDP ribazoletransferase [Rectinemataceae bacterium]|nr:adenosylcobinamide-GDP ribazoletransferase [Rectinemataceae bacterium]